jgi:hypothetical protein
MEIHVTVFVSAEETKRAISRAPVLAPLFASDSVYWVQTIEASSQALHVLVEATRTTPGFEWTIDVHFNDADTVAAAFFEMRPAKFLRHAEADADVNEYFARQAVTVSTAAGALVTLPRGAVVSKPGPGPNELIGLGDWYEEVAAGAGIAELLREPRWGVELIPLFDRKESAPSQERFQLFSSEFGPPAVRDRFVDVGGDAEFPRWTRIGAPVYEVVPPGEPHFRRTAEPWAGWRSPRWLVSAEAKAELTTRSKGCRFLPVLVFGSKEYRAHSAALDEVLDLLATNQRNTRRG